MRRVLACRVGGGVVAWWHKQYDHDETLENDDDLEHVAVRLSVGGLEGGSAEIS